MSSDENNVRTAVKLFTKLDCSAVCCRPILQGTVPVSAIFVVCQSLVYSFTVSISNKPLIIGPSLFSPVMLQLSVCTLFRGLTIVF